LNQSGKMLNRHARNRTQAPETIRQILRAVGAKVRTP